MHLAGEDMPADCLTKVVAKEKLEGHTRSIGLFPVNL